MQRIIPINNIHQCNEYCKTTLGDEITDEDGFIIGMKEIPNPTYNLETQKCDQADQVENCYIYISDYHKNPSKFFFTNSDEIVIPKDYLHIMFEYPLNKPVIFRVEAPQSVGFKLKDIIDIIVSKYYDIYQEEEKSSQNPVLSVEERLAQGVLINRNKTNGTYGIWGHDIGDLVLERIVYDQVTNMLNLYVGS